MKSKQFTDLFIEKPVLAIVVNLLILVLGLRSLGSLPIQQFPTIESSVITITTTYTGADAASIASFISTPLENSIAQAQGIDYLTSISSQNTSTIQANLLLDYSATKALTEITTQVNAVQNQLPAGAQLPVMTITTGQSIDSMYIGFYSKVLASNQITDYLLRVAQPKLQAINGVQNAEILGGRPFAMRIWLDPIKMAGYGVTPAEISQVLARNNFITAAGRTDGQMVVTNFTANTALENVDQFRKIVIKSIDGANVYLGDVGTVSLGAENYDSSVAFDGEPAVYIGILVAPDANLLTVIGQVKAVFAEIESEMPNGLQAKVVYDATAFVNSSIHEVIKSLVEAFLIVTVVVFLFLGSLRALFIPVIAIPLSLVGTFFIMLLLGYSINLLTLLALVLAIGLVVDDAIIVVENIHRHMEEGVAILQAALQGTRELASPIIAISIVLIAVYLPIGFMTGLTGALFTEFAFTLAGAVAVSAVIALTLSPVMCANFLKHETNSKAKFLEYIDKQFDRLRIAYERVLHNALDYLPVVAVFAVIILTSNYFLFSTSASELAPQEDQGILLTQITTAANAALQQTEIYSQEVYKVFTHFPELDHSFVVNGTNASTGVASLNGAMAGMVLKPWDQRARTSNELQPIVQQELTSVAGANIAAFQLPSLPGGGEGLPIQFVIKSTDSFDRMNIVIQNILKEAYASGKFLYIDPDLKIDAEQTSIKLNMPKIAELGLNPQDVGNTLSSALSEGYINYFNFAGRSYQLIPQVIRPTRINDSQILNYYIKTAQGQSIPLSTVASLQHEVVPEYINHFQQLNSVTISAIALPNVTMGEALNTFQSIAKNILPEGYSVDYASQSRQYIQESNALVITFIFALIIIFLALSALFNSFRDPLIVLISVPMSICGAMIFISMGVGGATLNIYTEVGLVTLIGLISKHGILIVQFANDLQKEGKAKREAIEMAAAVRLRPILMTTAAMVLGVIPLIIATGAGAVSRFNIGLVIATGISIGTLFTLFVVPAMYMLLADDYAEEAAAKNKDKNKDDDQKDNDTSLLENPSEDSP